MAAGVGAVGSEKFVDYLRVSPSTVDEPWMASLPGLVGGLLEKTHGAMELIVVDRSITLKGEVPDEEARKKLLEFSNPAREAGYEVVDELKAKGK